jgi:beta-lactamase class A
LNRDTLRLVVALFTFALAPLIFCQGSTVTVAQTVGALPVSANAGRADSPLEQAIKRVAETSGGIAGVAAIHVETGRRVSLNGGLRFPMASVFKLPIALQLLHRVDRGELRLNDSVALSEHDFRPGNSPIADLANNTPVTLTLGRLLELMLGESDNSACDKLLRLSGGPAAVTGRIRELGITGIDVNRPEGRIALDFWGVREPPPESEWTMALFESARAKATTAESERSTAYANDPRDTSTPEAMAELLARVERREALEAASTERLLQIMTATPTGPARLKGLLPAGISVAHKTGTMAGTTNDVGIITLPDGAGHLALAVFIKGSTKDVPERERAIAEIARTIYDYFVLQRD